MKSDKISEEKICENCKKRILEDVNFCPECGTQINNIVKTDNYYHSSNEETSNSTLSIIGFICALCGIITCGFTSIIGLIISIIASLDSSNKGKKDLWAISGIIISAVILSLLFLIAFGDVFSEPNSNSESYSSEENSGSSKERKKVIVIDFSQMNQEDIKKWCDDNKVNCSFKNEYSDIIDVNEFISQSVGPNEIIEEYDRIAIVYSLGREPTVSQKNAVRKAEQYLRYGAFSRKGLIDQLEYEKYPHEDAEYAVDHIVVDWNEQAVKKAESYLRYSAFSREGLIDQLLFEGYTYEQAVYGVEQNGL